MSQTKAQLLNPQGDFTLTGQLIGVGATFSGNVSIAGTLTKQDVTNVDSVGIITARSGVNVTGGNVFIGQGGSGANNAELKLQAGAGTGNDIIAFLNQAGATRGNLTYDTDNNFLLFNVNASERLRITATGRIEQTNNNEDIDMDAYANGQLRLDGNGYNAALALNAQGLNIYNNSANRAIIFGTNETERLRIKTDGSVNLTTANASLEWTASSGSNPFIRSVGSGQQSLEFNTGGNEVLRITSSGRFGLGTSSPDHKFEVEDNNSSIAISRTAANAQLLFKSNSVGQAGQIQVSESSGGGVMLFSTKTTGGSVTERLRIGTAGQIGIAGANYGTSGQVLTSGGSGSTISWVDAAGGAEFAGIASGSISTGNPVMVHPDGKLGKVQNSYTENIAIGGASNGDTEIGQPGVRTLYFPDEDGTERYLFLYRYNMSNYYRTATRGGNSLTLATRGNSTGQGAGHFAVGYNPDRKRAVMMFYQQSPGGYCAVRVIRPNGTSISGGSVVQVDTGGGVNGVGVAYHGDDKFILVWARGGTVYSKILTVTSSSNYTGISLGNTVTVGSAGGNIGLTIHISEKDNNGKHMLFYPVFPTGTRYGGFGINYAVISVSGTTPSFGSISHLGGSAEREYEVTNMLVDSSFDSSQNRYLVVYKQIHDGTGTYINKTYVVNAAISGTSITMSSQVELTNNITDTTPSTAFDSNLKKHFVFLYSTANSDSVVAHPFTFTGSATPTAGSTFNIETGDKVWYGQVIFSQSVGKLIFGARNADASGAGNWLRARVVSTSNVQTNLKRENFLGFSKGNYTDGQTAKVNVNGSVDENQSSLTPGETYFVQKDGTLSLSSDTTRVVAGQAASSTNLIVRDENPRQGILGFWQYHLQQQGSAYKPWCACRYVGGYARDQNGNNNFCTGKWTPWCCNGTAVNSGQQHVWDISDENGGNMCISCGGLSKGSQFCMHTSACCCCCPDGRFYFPSTGLYCYNFDMMWLSCQQMAVGGCWNVSTLWNGRKCHNNACNQCMWPIQNWRGNPNTCLYCDSRMWANNIFISGMVSVADPAANFILWKVCDSSLGVQIKNNGLFQCEAGIQQVSNWVNFTKLSNSPGLTYCN